MGGRAIDDAIDSIGTYDLGALCITIAEQYDAVTLDRDDAVDCKVATDIG